MSYFLTGGVAVGERWYDTDKASINADGTTISREYKVFKVDRTAIDENAVVVAVAAATPLLRGTLIRRNIECQRKSEATWFATVTWETFRPRDQNESGYEEIIRGSTGGQTTPITHAINHVNSYDTAGAITDPKKTHQGALNVRKTKTGFEVSPVDVVVRSLEFVIERSFNVGTVTNSYIDTLYNLTATTNDATFRSLAAGEVLFLGADFVLNNLERETVSYSFSASPNVTNVKIGQYQGSGGITISKLGHEYLWTEHAVTQETATDTSKQMKAKLKAAHVEQVYYESDFSLLGI